MTYEEEVAYFENLTNAMVNTFKAKRHDYGPSTRTTWEKFGPMSMLVRMTDKMSRLEQLLSPNAERKVMDESVQDTLLDLANYCLITILEMHTQKNKK